MFFNNTPSFSSTLPWAWCVLNAFLNTLLCGTRWALTWSYKEIVWTKETPLKRKAAGGTMTFVKLSKEIWTIWLNSAGTCRRWQFLKPIIQSPIWTLDLQHLKCIPFQHNEGCNDTVFAPLSAYHALLYSGLRVLGFKQNFRFCAKKSNVVISLSLLLLVSILLVLASGHEQHWKSISGHWSFLKRYHTISAFKGLETCLLFFKWESREATSAQNTQLCAFIIATVKAPIYSAQYTSH